MHYTLPFFPQCSQFTWKWQNIVWLIGLTDQWGSKPQRERHREGKQEWVWRLNTLTALDIQPTSQPKRFTGLGNWQMSYSTKQRNEVKWMGQLRVKQKLGKCRLLLFHSFYTSTSQFMSFESIKHVFWTFFVLFHLFPASSFMTQNEIEWKWKFT